MISISSNFVNENKTKLHACITINHVQQAVSGLTFPDPVIAIKCPHFTWTQLKLIIKLLRTVAG